MKPIIPLALLALALLPGCRAQRDQLKQAMSGQPPVIAGSLEGDWVLADLNGGGAPTPAITLRFDGGDHGTSQVTGNSGCNRFTGDWQQEGRTLKLGPVASTQMGCAASVMAVEQRFVAALVDVRQLVFTEAGEALLATPDGRRLRLRRPPQ
ncbi:META domain-containing protein [Sandarakinorhabdus sp.]|uniref:META domain-containing protein n=1 Tax=Sandarakinorhabdus sp. TaxID=1916663 RepID=UPI003F71A72A